MQRTAQNAGDLDKCPVGMSADVPAEMIKVGRAYAHPVGGSRIPPRLITMPCRGGSRTAQMQRTTQNAGDLDKCPVGTSVNAPAEMIKVGRATRARWAVREPPLRGVWKYYAGDVFEIFDIACDQQSVFYLCGCVYYGVRELYTTLRAY